MAWMQRFVKPISYKRHRFPADVIRQAVWLYYGFTLRFGDVEELLAQRGVEVSYEAIQSWTADRQCKGPLPLSQLRRTGLMSGRSRPPHPPPCLMRTAVRSEKRSRSQNVR